ncbi:MAG: hypothetical protein KC502_20020 [Myxococcales bacterium]|nr:hypothetical protein [Myxococcales bacterium]
MFPLASPRFALSVGLLCAALGLATLGCKGPSDTPAPNQTATKEKPITQPAPAKSAAGANASSEPTDSEKAEKSDKDKARAVAAVARKLQREGGSASGGLPNIAPGMIERAVINAKTAPGEDKDIAAKWMVKRIKNVAANHDKEGIKRWCTPRMAKEIDDMLPKHGERFWRHMDRYARAGAQGYATSDRRQEGDKLHLTVTSAGDIVLKPVLVRSAQGWRFDRF